MKKTLLFIVVVGFLSWTVSALAKTDKQELSLVYTGNTMGLIQSRHG